jgi:hypothetical protein
MARTLDEDKAVLDKLLDEWDQDSKVDKSCPNETAAEISSLHAKYLRTLSKNTLNAQEADKEYLTMKKLRTKYYGGEMTQAELTKLGWEQYLGKSPRVSSQWDDAMKTDPFLLEIEQRKKVYELIVANCEKIIKELGARHYTIKAFMDWERTIRNG